MDDDGTTRRLRKADRKRITCQRPNCERPADLVELRRWQVGSRSGLSFFYFCDPCYGAMLERRAARAQRAMIDREKFIRRQVAEAKAMLARYQNSGAETLC